MLISGCQTTSEVIITTSTPQQLTASAIAPPATQTPQPTATLQLTERFLNGDEIDLSALSLEERANFSIELVNRLEMERGAQPIFFKITDGSLWIKADENFASNHAELANEIIAQEGSLFHVNADFFDKHPEIAQEITPRKYLPIRTDSASGSLQYIDDVTGDWITVLDSKDINYSHSVIDESNIVQAIQESWLDWPRTNLLGSEYGKFEGMTGIQAMIGGYNKDEGREYSLVLGVIKETILQDIPINFYQGGWDEEGFLKVLVIEVDKSGNPIFAKIVFVTSAGGTTFFEEGSDRNDQSMIRFLNNEDVFKYFGLRRNGFIWIMILKNQENMWQNNQLAAFNDLSGSVRSQNAHSDLIGQTIENESLLIGAGWVIVTSEKK